MHGVRLGRSGGEDQLPADKKRPQFAGDLFVLSSFWACNTRMALDLASISSGYLRGLEPDHTAYRYGQLDTMADPSV
jgi:hypothetical protein